MRYPMLNVLAPGGKSRLHRAQTQFSTLAKRLFNLLKPPQGDLKVLKSY